MMDSFSLILRNFEYRNRETDICACLNICICFPVSDMQCIFCSLIFFTEANSSTTHFWVGNKKGNAVDWATPKWKHQQVRYLSVCTQTAVKLVISSQCDFFVENSITDLGLEEDTTIFWAQTPQWWLSHIHINSFYSHVVNLPNQRHSDNRRIAVPVLTIYSYATPLMNNKSRCKKNYVSF